jgi:hypothetical protein
VVETEGTNEALADLQDRCGPGVFALQSRGYVKPTQLRIDNRKVFRILRERRCVRAQPPSFFNVYTSFPTADLVKYGSTLLG